MSQSVPLNRNSVMSILPHRDPMLFIDSVTKFDDTTVTAQTLVRSDWPVFKGHFPDLPIMPGVLLIETIAQGGALILGLKGAVQDGRFIALTGVEATKFRRAVKPGDVMDIQVELVRERRGFYKFEGTVSVEGDLAAEVKFSAAQMGL